MGVKLVSSSAGSVELVAPVTASNYTATMPAGTGSVVVNGVNGSIVSGTAQASTSGTSIDFTSIPSWVKRITVMFNAVSTSGSASDVTIQLGSGSVTTTGYSTLRSYISGTSASAASFTSSSIISFGTASSASLKSGLAVITLVSGNTWVSSGQTSEPANSQLNLSNGVIALGGTLDRIRITTSNGTDTFDAGSVNILYE